MYVSGENSNKQLLKNESNDGFFGEQCISPPKKVDFDVSGIKSFSSYSDHSVWINKDGNAFAIGNNNRSQINDSSYGTFYERPTQITIDGFSSSEKEYFVSAVCGDNYTLYMTSSNRIIYIHERGKGKPLFLKLKIPNPKSQSKSSKSSDKYTYRKPLGLFGGCNRAAVIDDEGDIFVFSEELFDSKNPVPKHYSLPESIKSVACCNSFLVALSCSGKVYGNGEINEDDDEFIEIEELSDLGPFIQISGTYEHCIALNEEGRAYGFGSNYKGRLSLDSEIRTVSTFVLLSAFDDLKVYAISAGFNHSLFLMKETELASCGTNSYGELGAIKPTKDCYYTPIKTKIIAETKIPYFIAGYNTSFAFVDCEAPPNCPNKNIEIKKKRTPIKSVSNNNSSNLTSSARKKIEDSRSNTSKKYLNDIINNQQNYNKNPEQTVDNSAELKALTERVSELTAALEKSEEEKTVAIKKLLEISQMADQLYNTNKELAARVLKYEITLGLLAVAANASSDSGSDDEKEKKEKEEKEKKEKEEKEKKEREEKEKKEKIEREKKEKMERESREKEKQSKKKQQESKQKPSSEDENKQKQRKRTDHKSDKQTDQQQKKKQYDSQQTSTDDEENRQKQHRKKQQDSKPKSSEDETKQSQTDQKSDKQNRPQHQKQQTKNQQDSKSKSKDEVEETKPNQKQPKKSHQETKPKSTEEENKQKQSSSQTVTQQQDEQEQSEESSKRHRHHHHKRNQEQHQREQQQQQQEQSQNQNDQQKRKKPKEPSDENDQEQKHAPRRRHRHNDKQQAPENNNENDESKNLSQKINPPPSILTQKENEQKKSIIRPAKSKK